jgi:two-component system, LuxR family, response regulator FixJ
MPLDENRKEALRLVARLSRQEKQILAGLANGRTTTSIAAALSIVPQEAEHARSVLMEKLSARTTADAVRIAIYANVSWPR